MDGLRSEVDEESVVNMRDERPSRQQRMKKYREDIPEERKVASRKTKRNDKLKPNLHEIMKSQRESQEEESMRRKRLSDELKLKRL